MAADTHSLTLRLPKELYDASRSLARRRGVSLNSLVQEQLGDAIRAERQRRIYESFDALASNPDEDTDVEWMVPLQRDALEMSDASAQEG